MDISGWRRKIDEIDEKIIELLNERAECAVAIGVIKRENKMPVIFKDRENEIMKRIIKRNTGPLSESQICEVFSLIIEHSRQLQNTK